MFSRLLFLYIRFPAAELDKTLSFLGGIGGLMKSLGSVYAVAHTVQKALSFYRKRKKILACGTALSDK